MGEHPYGTPPRIEPDPYLAAWRDLKRRKHWARVGALLAIYGPALRLFFPPGSSQWLAIVGAGLLGLPFGRRWYALRDP